MTTIARGQPRSRGRLCVLIAITALTSAIANAQAPPPTAVPVATAVSGVVVGVAYDSLRDGTVDGAIIQLIAAGRPRREAVTKKDGQFVFDTVAPGTYILQMLHATLDTLGFLVNSPQFTVAAGHAVRVELSIPSARGLVPRLCTPALLARGPSALVGFVRDPDTRMPVEGANVLLDATNKDVFGAIKIPFIRTATTDARGQFRICGLPATITGKVVATRNGVSSGEVPVEIKDNLLVLRGISFSLANRTVTMVGDSGRTVQFLQGNARLTGKVLNDRGQPLAGARVAVINTQASTKTDAAGRFTLDSLPAGSATVQIIAMGYGITERPVEITSTDPPTSTTVTMDRFLQLLPAVHTVTDAHQTALDKVGYTAHKKTSIGGVQKDGDDLDQAASRVTEMLRDIPGIKVTRVDTGSSEDNQIQTTTNGFRGDCIEIRIDAVPFHDSAGELDRELQADVIEAIEFYDVASIPGDWRGRSKNGCALLLLWTRAKVPHRGGG